METLCTIFTTFLLSLKLFQNKKYTDAHTHRALRWDNFFLSYRVKVVDAIIPSNFFGKDVLFPDFVPPISHPLPRPWLLFQERTLRGSGEVQEDLSEGTYSLWEKERLFSFWSHQESEFPHVATDESGHFQVAFYTHHAISARYFIKWKCTYWDHI